VPPIPRVSGYLSLRRLRLLVRLVRDERSSSLLRLRRLRDRFSLPSGTAIVESGTPMLDMG
jgi:hypothetical protein